VVSHLSTTLKQELLALKEASPDKALHPAAAVEWARRHRASALYNALEWDDRKAAHEYRLSQVRTLIHVHVTTGDGEPILISLSIDRSSGGGYRSIADVAKAPDLRQIMFDDALRDLERVKTKYRHVAELKRVWDEADAAKAAKSSPPPPPSGGPPPGRKSGSGGSGAGPKSPGPKGPPPKKGPGRPPRGGYPEDRPSP
jgi:hypothetical protein